MGEGKIYFSFDISGGHLEKGCDFDNKNVKLDFFRLNKVVCF